jgi:hypothetical protein
VIVIEGAGMTMRGRGGKGDFFATEAIIDPAVTGVKIGDRLLFFGRTWTVTRVHPDRRYGDLYALRAEDDATTELISANGADGGFEVLA